MSTFEDYQKVSKNYDDERSAMGADVMAGLLHVHGGKPLKVSNGAKIRNRYNQVPQTWEKIKHCDSQTLKGYQKNKGK